MLQAVLLPLWRYLYSNCSPDSLMWQRLNALSAHRWFHPVLLLVWLLLGSSLRLIGLTSKPLWTDEFATIVFGLGHSFLTMPLDRVITTETLLQPLRPDGGAGLGAVVSNLLRESNHPPLYFILTHIWLRLFPAVDGLVSVQGLRSLAALLGIASIPASFGLGWLAFRSRLLAQLAAAVMAVSPFSIYLAQEARHYTLPILWIIASLSCLMVAARTVRHRTPLPWKIVLLWIVINALGIATHYFFVLTLVAEAITLLCLGLAQSWREQGIWHPSYWGRLWTVAVGTAASGLMWVPLLQGGQNSELTQWIYRHDRVGLEWLDPVGQALAGWITMLYLLPIQAIAPWLTTLFGLVLIGLVLWTVPQLVRGLRVWTQAPQERLIVLVFSCVVGAAIALFFAITYGASIDLTSAFRYNFVYFPAVVILVAAGLAALWREPNQTTQPGTDGKSPHRGQRVVMFILLMSFVGGVTVSANWGYQKTHRPDAVAQTIAEATVAQPLIAIAHRTHGQTGRLMGIAWELRQWPRFEFSPLYLLAHETRSPTAVALILQQALNATPRPLDLWLVNIQEISEPALDRVLSKQNCSADEVSGSVDGYRYQLYRCGDRQPMAG